MSLEFLIGFNLRRQGSKIYGLKKKNNTISMLSGSISICSIENPIQLNWCSDQSQLWDIFKHEGIQSMESISSPTNETNYEWHFYN